MNIPLEISALGYGLFSASSLIIGAGLGIVTSPSERLTAILMAFGAGCLIYAVTVGLYGSSQFRLSQSPTEEMLAFRFTNNILQTGMSILGALMYLGLNELLLKLQNRGDDDDNDPDCRSSRDVEMRRSSSSVAGTRAEQLMGKVDSHDSSPSSVKSFRNPSRVGVLTGRSKSGSSASFLTRNFHQNNTKGSIHAARAGLSVEGDQFVRSEAKRNNVISVEDIQAPGDHEDDAHKSNVAFSMWLGLLLDGFPESLLIGFMTNSGKLTTLFLIAIFIANFPEAFSAAAILKAQNVSAKQILAMWGFVFIMTGTLAMTGSFIMPHDTQGNHELEKLEERGGALLEGMTGGSMMAMIATAMLPEAFHSAGMHAGLFFVAGFVTSDMISGTGGFAGGVQCPPLDWLHSNCSAHGGH